MAQVVVLTSSVPTDTLYDVQTVLSESTFRSRARVTTVTTVTSEGISLDIDGDPVPATTVIVADV